MHYAITDKFFVLVDLHVCVASCLYLQLINRETKTEGERCCNRETRRRRVRESNASHAYSLPVWLCKTVTLFAWLVELLRRDWPCNIILPLPSSFLSSLIHHSSFPSFPFSSFWPLFKRGLTKRFIYTIGYEKTLF